MKSYSAFDDGGYPTDVTSKKLHVKQQDTAEEKTMRYGEACYNLEIDLNRGNMDRVTDNPVDSQIVSGWIGYQRQDYVRLGTTQSRSLFTRQDDFLCVKLVSQMR